MHPVIRRTALVRGVILWTLVRTGGVVVVAVVSSTGMASLTPSAIAAMAPGSLLVVGASGVADELAFRREGTLLQDVGAHRFAIVGVAVAVAAVLELAFLATLGLAT